MGIRLGIIACLVLMGCVASAPAETTARREVDRHYIFAQGLYQQGLFDLAAEEFARFSERYPKDGRREAAVFYAAQSLFQSETGKRERALAALRKYQEEYSGSQTQFYHTSFYLAGEILFQNAEAGRGPEATGRSEVPSREVREAYESALSAFLRCAELSPDRNEAVFAALWKASHCGTLLEKWQEAAWAYQNLAERYQSVRAQFLAGEVLYRWGQTSSEKLSDAMRAYKRVALYGDNAFEDDAAMGVAWCLYKREKWEECRQFLQETIREGLFSRIDRDFKQNESKLPEAYYLLGACSMGVGERAAAANWFRLLSKHRESPFRKEGLAKLGELLGENVNPLTEEGAEISYVMAQKLMESGKMREAVGEFERIYETSPKSATAAFREPLLYDLSISYERLGYYQEALAILGYLSRQSSDLTWRAKAARGEALCHQAMAQEADEPHQKRAEELAAVAALERSAASSAGREAEEALGDAADFYFSRQMYERARGVYEEHLARFPGSSRRADTLFRIGQCILRGTSASARIEEAASVFERCRKEFPSSRVAVFATEQLAVLFAKSSELEAALVEYSRLQADNFPGLPEEDKRACEAVFENAAYARGTLRERMGDSSGAVSELELLLREHPTSEKAGQARLHLSKLYFREGQFEEAVRILGPCFEELEKCPDLETALILSVRGLVKLERADEAVSRVGEVLRSPPGRNLPKSTFARLSRVLEKEGYQQGARLPYVVLIERYRGLDRGMMAAATNTREMVEKKEYAKAVHYCSDLFAIHAPDRAAGWTGNAEEAGDSPRDRALQCLHGLEAIRAEARSTLRTAFWELGELELRLGNPAAGARAFESAAAIHPPTKQHFEVLFKAGSAWKQAGELQRALNDFEEIVRSARDPEHSLRAQLAIGTMWLESGDARRSLGSYLRIINFHDARDPAVRPWIAQALFQSGVAFERLKKNEEAKRQFEMLVRDFERERTFESLIGEAKQRLKLLSDEKKPGGVSLL